MVLNTEMYLQTTFVDESFQNALLPVNLLQYTSFLSKYTIRNNFIYPKGYVYHILSFCFIGLMIYANYRIDAMDLTFETAISFSLNFVFYCCDCVLLLFSNIYSSKYAIQLVLKVQKITNSFRNIMSKDYFKNWKRENWIYVGGIYFVYLLVAFMIMFAFHYKVITSITRFVYVFALLYYDVNIICAFRYVKLCEDCLRWWISNVKFYSKQLNNYGNEIGKMNSEYHLKGLLDAYLDILSTFDMIKNIFQLPVLLQIIEYFVHALIYSQIFIEMGKAYAINNTEKSGILAQSFVFSWIVKNILVLSLCIKGCEEFYISIKKAEKSCLMHLRSNKHPELKKLYKNVIRLNRSKFTKMSACGFITIDATLPLKFFDQLAVYIIVLLQFAFHIN